MTDRLKDKIAIVTGADSGIGQATAEAFPKEGADVVITYYRDEEGAEETCAKVEAAGRRAVVVQCDQRDPAQVEQVFQETEEKLGIPFILVNNAGIDPTGKQVADMPDEDWDRERKSRVSAPPDMIAPRAACATSPARCALSLRPTASTSTTSPPAW